MFNLAALDDIREAADLRHEIVAYQIEQLSLLGYKRDIAFIFPDGYASPDWSYSDALPEDAREIVRKVYLLCEDIERAERELRLRALNIDVDSAAFAAFQDKFDKYKAALDKTPAAWRGVGTLRFDPASLEV
jgi:hypothetical protein